MRFRPILPAILFAAASLSGCAQAHVSQDHAVSSGPVERLIGAWHLDSAKMSSTGGGTGSGRGGGGGAGGGLGMGPSPETLVIRLGGTTLTVDEIRGSATSRLTFLLNGQRMANTIGIGDAARQGVYTSAWIGERLVTTITAPAAKGSKEMVTYEDIRYVDDTGLLVVNISIIGRPNSRHLVYARGRS